MPTATSIPSSGPSAMWQQLQSQRAQRAADQADQAARVLQAQAREAKAVAERAQNSARTLEIKASQAQEKATQANQNVRASQAWSDVQTRLGGLYTNLPQMMTYGLQASAQTQAVATTASTGTLVNTTA